MPECRDRMQRNGEAGMSGGEMMCGCDEASLHPTIRAVCIEKDATDNEAGRWEDVSIHS